MKAIVRRGLILITGIALGSGITLGAQAIREHTQLQAQRQAETPKAITIPLGLRGDPSLGDPNAPITVVEFSDFQCPYCKRFHDEVLPSLKKEYIDKGLVRFVHKDLPLPFHKYAREAAITARCSTDQAQYWKAYQALFQNQECFGCKGIGAIANHAGITPKTLEGCKKAGSAHKAVNSNISESQLQGIRATPSFVIGPSQGSEHTGQLVEGAMPWPQFKKMIDDAIKRSKAQ